MFKAGAAGLSATGRATAIAILQWAFLGITFLLFLWWIPRNWIEFPAPATACLLGVTLLAYPKHLSPFAMGMESTLLMLLIPLFLMLVFRSKWGLAGLVGLFLVMARLDSLVYVVFPITLYVAFRDRQYIRTIVRRGLMVGGPALAGVFILMAVYQLTFGHPVPIHGVLRSTFPNVNFQPHLFAFLVVFARHTGSLGALATIQLPTAPVILLICGLVLFRTGFLNGRERSGAWLIVVLGFIQLLAFLLFQAWAKPVSEWYLAPLMIFTSGAVGAAAVNILGGRRTAFACLILALLMAGLSAFREYRRWNVPVPRSVVHAFVKSRPADAVWAATDCGNIAFRTGGTFLNLDGLINGFEYQEALKRHDLNGYLERAGADYLIVNTWDARPPVGRIERMYKHKLDPAFYEGQYDTYDFFVYSYMYDCYSDTLRLSQDQEVFRSGPESDGMISTKAVIFDLTE